MKLHTTMNVEDNTVNMEISPQLETALVTIWNALNTTQQAAIFSQITRYLAENGHIASGGQNEN